MHHGATAPNRPVSLSLFASSSDRFNQRVGSAPRAPSLKASASHPTRAERNYPTHFISAVSLLIVNDRKVLLFLDGYRSHMAVSTLELLDAHNIVVYALLDPLSGKTQPLDVTVFSGFKAALKDAIDIAVLRTGDKN